MLFSRRVNCGRTAGRIEMPLGKNFRRQQIFFLEISGPKVILLCKLSLYRAVRAGPGPCGFNLTSLMDDPALQDAVLRSLAPYFRFD